MKTLKAECFLWLVPEKSIREIWNTRRIWCTFPDLKMEGTMWEGPESSRQQCLAWQAAKNWILPTAWMILEADFPPEPPDKNSAQPTRWFQPCNTLSRIPVMACQTCVLQNCELINGCCFKLVKICDNYQATTGNSLDYFFNGRSIKITCCDHRSRTTEIICKNSTTMIRKSMYFKKYIYIYTLHTYHIFIYMICVCV